MRVTAEINQGHPQRRVGEHDARGCAMRTATMPFSASGAPASRFDTRR
jgi:hypothetical protein